MNEIIEKLESLGCTLTPITYNEEGLITGAGLIRLERHNIDVWYHKYEDKEDAIKKTLIIAEALNPTT